MVTEDAPAVGFGDDFGTGYSSLSYLRKFPFDELKIDKSFIDDLAGDTADGALVAGIVGMAHALGYDVTAEGVETEQQLAQLRTLGCEAVQGHYFARPSHATEISLLLEGVGVTWAVEPNGCATGTVALLGFP